MILGFNFFLELYDPLGGSLLRIIPSALARNENIHHLHLLSVISPEHSFVPYLISFSPVKTYYS